MFRWTCIAVAGLAALISVTFACRGRTEFSVHSKENPVAEEKKAFIPSAEAMAVVEAMRQERGKGPENLVTDDGIHKLYLTHETTFVPFGGDTNSRPPFVFAGKLFSEMDRLAVIATKRLLYASPLKSEYGVVTFITNDLKFHRPVKVGDMLVVSSLIIATGEKSVTVRVTISRENRTAAREVVASGDFITVVTDEKGVSTAHGLPKFGTQEPK